MTSTRRKSLTDNMIKAEKPDPEKRLTISDPDCRGLYVRITTKGAKSFCAVARDPDGAQVWATIGSTDHISIDKAREKARKAIGRIKEGLTPFEAPPVEPDTFKAIAENFIKRHVEKEGLRSKPEIERILNKYIYPAWKKQPFEEIGRKNVSKLLDKVEDNHGPRQAEYCLQVIRKIMNWYAPRTDDYRSPIVPGMRRYSPKKNARERTLDADEIRVFWKASEGKGAYNGMIHFALLTGQRRGKIAALKWADVSDDGIWTIQTDDREKGHGGVLKLPEMAFAIIKDRTPVGDNPYVFGGSGKGVFTGWSPSKLAFDKKILKAQKEDADDPKNVKPLEPWVFHDLRRTFRSLLSKAGIQGDIAERVMGHAIQGVEGIYDRHEYADEKANALEALSSLMETIIDPPKKDKKVVSLEAKLSKKRISAIR